MRVNYTYPIFNDLLAPHGFLGLNKRFHACWDFTRKAMRARERYAGGIENQVIQYKVGSSIADMPKWRESHDEEIARSTAIIYQLESPDEFLKPIFISACRLQARALGLNVDESIYTTRPGRQRLQ